MYLKPKSLIACLAIYVSLFPVKVFSANASNMLFDGGTSAILFNVHRVNLKIVDQVTDQCMPRPNSVKQAAEAALRRNDFRVVGDEESDGTRLIVNVLGYENAKSSCVVYFESILRVFRLVTVPGTHELDTTLNTTLAPLNYAYGGNLLSGPKSSMQERIERETERNMDQLFIQIDKARDKVRENWPKVWNANSEDHTGD